MKIPAPQSDVDLMNAYIESTRNSPATVWHDLASDGFFYIKQFGEKFNWYELTMIGGSEAHGFKSLEECKADVDDFIRRTRGREPIA